MLMKRLLSIFAVLALCAGAYGSWYWPFSSDDEKPPRVSELMEGASIMIDEAYDLAADGKTSEAVEKFRAALAELDRIEMENPDRVKEPEFNTLKNKRATVTAAIDSLLLNEAQVNAKPIAVTDTTELQKKYEAKLAAKKNAAKGNVGDQSAANAPRTDAEKAIAALKAKDYEGVERAVAAMLAAKPNDVAALNLRAAAEIGRGYAKAAERTLNQAMKANPESYYAFYNMARLVARSKDGSIDAARRYYETGRALGGPVDKTIEGMLK